MMFRKARQNTLWFLQKTKPVCNFLGWCTLATLFGIHIVYLCGGTSRELSETVFFGAFLFLWLLVIMNRVDEYFVKLKEEDDMDEKTKSLTLGEYQTFVEGLASEASVKDFQCRIATVGLGLGGEGGEIADYIKKVLFHGKEFSREELIKELGDVQWYVAFACNTLNISMQEVIDKNVDKLKNRYPQGKFTREDFLRKEEGEKPTPSTDFSEPEVWDRG